MDFQNSSADQSKDQCEKKTLNLVEKYHQSYSKKQKSAKIRFTDCKIKLMVVGVRWVVGVGNQI